MHLRRNRVLLIHQNQAVAKTRAVLLRKNGYSVRVGRNAEQARSILRLVDVDLVIVDTQTNHTAAVELCEELKQQKPETCVAIIAWYNTPVRSHCPDDVIRREDGPQALLASVQELLPNPGAPV